MTNRKQTAPSVWTPDAAMTTRDNPILSRQRRNVNPPNGWRAGGGRRGL